MVLDLVLKLVLHARSDLQVDLQYAIMKAAGFLTWARSASRASKKLRALMPREVVISPGPGEGVYDSDDSEPFKVT